MFKIQEKRQKKQSLKFSLTAKLYLIPTKKSMKN